MSVVLPQGMFNWVRTRARRSGLDFTLTSEWIDKRIQKGICEMTGLPLKLYEGPSGSRHRCNPFRPSIDRINSSKGYHPENCRLVCWIFNIAKSDWDDAVVLQFAKALVKEHGARDKSMGMAEAGTRGLRCRPSYDSSGKPS